MKNTKKLTISAAMIALSTVLSMITFFKMPMGGSVTPFSMLPIALVAYAYGPAWGLSTCCIHGLIQMMFDLDYLSYGTWWGAVAMIILFDYIVAFGVIGFAGVFKKVIGNQVVAFSCGVALGCALRFLCHFLTGCTVWAETGASAAAILTYSLTYNGSYMLPEMVLTVVAGSILISLPQVRKLLKDF